MSIALKRPTLKCRYVFQFCAILHSTVYAALNPIRVHKKPLVFWYINNQLLNFTWRCDLSR